MNEIKKQSPFRSGYVDFHTHILPQMDDGSRSAEQSVEMLRLLFSQGVSTVALTPHFYADGDDPQRFFARRERSYAQLCEALASAQDLSSLCIVLGAEVEYFEGIAGVDCLSDFGIGACGYILLEMPHGVWTPHIIDDVLLINERRDCRVIIAHVERYLLEQKKDTVHTLLQNGILMQSNAEFFTDRKSARKALSILDRGWIHLLGTDCHNLTTRPPKISDAADLIIKKTGIEPLQNMMERAMYLLGADVPESTYTVQV